jgi:hypothetical protein
MDFTLDKSITIIYYDQAMAIVDSLLKLGCEVLMEYDPEGYYYIDWTHPEKDKQKYTLTNL